MLTTDWHLDLRCPRARAETEPGAWADVQRGYLEQLKRIAGDLPIVCAGDVFNRWDAPAELINWAIEHMPVVYACCGQHDLPHHRYEDIGRTAYWTLVQAGKIVNLAPGIPRRLPDGSLLYGFPWRFEPTPLPPGESARPAGLSVAVIHRYVWATTFSYPGADDAAHISGLATSLVGYDAAVVGDNHKGFLAELTCDGRAMLVLNHGRFIPQFADERDYVPHVGILYSDATIERVPLDTSADRWVDAADLPNAPAAGVDAAELMGILNEASQQVVSFADAVRRVADARPDLSPGTKRYLAEWTQPPPPKP